MKILNFSNLLNSKHLTSLRILNLSSFYTRNIEKYTDIFSGNKELNIIINKSKNPKIILNLPEGVIINETEQV